MQQPRILIRKVDRNRYEEVGEVLAATGKQLTVRLADGSEVEHVRGAGEMTPVQWSFVHLLRVSPEHLREALSDRPALVLKQVLSEAGKPLGVADLKKRIGDLVNDPGLATSAVDTGRKALEKDPEVETSAGNPMRYRARHTPSGFRLLFPSRPTPYPPDPEPVEEVLVGQPTATAPSPVSGDGPTGWTLAERLAVAAPTEIPGDDDPRASPLAVGAYLSSLSRHQRTALVDGLARDDRRVVALLMGPKKGDPLESQLADVEGAQVRATLDRALLEASAGVTSSQAQVLLSLARRAEAADVMRKSDLVAVASTCASVDPPVLEGVSWVASSLADRFSRASEAGHGLSEPELGSLAAATQRIPVDRRGPRARMLSSLARVDPEQARLPRWWRGVDLDSLADLARGPSSHLLEMEEVRLGVLEPKVRRALSDEPSRRTISTVIAWPPALAGLVTGEQLAGMLGRLATSDSIVRSWIEVVSNAQAVRDLRVDVEHRDRQLAELTTSVEALSAQLEKARAEARRAAAALAAARSAADDDTAAHDRQARIDGIRGIATTVALVKQSAAAREDIALLRSVDHVAAREGLEPTAEPAQRVDFDPSLHDSLTPRLQPGSAADVVRGGFRWLDGATDAVILKAQVVRAADDGGAT